MFDPKSHENRKRCGINGKADGNLPDDGSGLEKNAAGRPELGRQLASLIRKNCASTMAGFSILVAKTGR